MSRPYFMYASTDYTVSGKKVYGFFNIVMLLRRADVIMTSSKMPFLLYPW